MCGADPAGPRAAQSFRCGIFAVLEAKNPPRACAGDSGARRSLQRAAGQDADSAAARAALSTGGRRSASERRRRASDLMSCPLAPGVRAPRAPNLTDPPPKQ